MKTLSQVKISYLAKKKKTKDNQLSMVPEVLIKLNVAMISILGYILK